MRPRLIILSDVWGGSAECTWISEYITYLREGFEIGYYNVCDLGGIDSSVIDTSGGCDYDFGERKLNQQFVDGGFDVATERLIKYETEKIDVLAFGIGGAVAWKAALNGLEVRNLFAVSSNALGREILKPKCNINLYYAEFDEDKPDVSWFNNIELQYFSIFGVIHYMYSDPKFIYEVCLDIISWPANRSVLNSFFMNIGMPRTEMIHYETLGFVG